MASLHPSGLARYVVAAALLSGVACGFAQDPPPAEPPPQSRGPAHFKDVPPGGWSWLEDYAFLSATYVIGCPRDRRCRVGTGIFVGGSPRGTEKDFTGDVEVDVYGLGALHVRVMDGEKPARIGFYRKTQGLFPIYPPPSLPK